MIARLVWELSDNVLSRSTDRAIGTASLRALPEGSERPNVVEHEETVRCHTNHAPDRFGNSIEDTAHETSAHGGDAEKAA